MVALSPRVPATTITVSSRISFTWSQMARSASAPVPESRAETMRMSSMTSAPAKRPSMRIWAIRLFKAAISLSLAFPSVMAWEAF